MLASETRQHAREALQGKWGKAALATLVYFLLVELINIVLSLIPVIGSIAQTVIELPLTFGFTVTLIKLKRGKSITYTEFFNTGFSNFASSWKVSLWTFVKMIVPIILIVVSFIIICIGYGFSTTSFSTPTFLNDTSSNINITTGAIYGASTVIVIFGFIAFIASSIWATIKSYYYKPVFYILFDNPNMSAKEVVEESARIMTGNRWKYFCLELSFIGWFILAFCTFGIGFLWLLPYLVIAEIVFYEYISDKNTTANVGATEGTESETESEAISDN